MGNVSYVVPSIHPMLAVAPPGISIHTPGVHRSYARGEEGDRAVLDGAQAMAMTVADLWLDPSRVEAAKASFDEAVATVPPPASTSVSDGHGLATRVEVASRV